MTRESEHIARQAARVGVCCLLVLSGCAQQPPRAAHGFDSSAAGAALGDLDSIAACTADTATASLSASALPIAMPADLVAKGSLATQGTLARRLSVAFAPGGFKPGESLLWSRVSVRTLGGTVEGWTRLQSDGVLIEAMAPSLPAPGPKRRDAREQAVVSSGAGYITVTRSASASASLATALSLDVLILPGGIAIEEPIVRIPALWNSDGKPLAPDALRIELSTARHPPGYDIIEASVTLDYVLWQNGAGASALCKGSAETRTTLADRDTVRPALWDLGVSALNGPRIRWLALSDSASGVFRAVFDSPTAASSFANWIRATRAAQAGPYRLGVFERDGRIPLRPLAPVDRAAQETFRVLTPQDTQAVRTGPLGEP